MPNTKRTQVYVLLAPGFKESDVVTMTQTWRNEGISVVLVGLTAGPIRGDFGMALIPDASFSTIADDCPDAVVIPGGAHGIRLLSADPRVHALLHHVIIHQGYVVAMGDAHNILEDLRLWAKGTSAAATPFVPSELLEQQPDDRLSGLAQQIITGERAKSVQDAALMLAAHLKPGSKRQ